MMACIANDWRPAIGDPTIMGWLTVAAYFAAAIAALVRADQERLEITDDGARARRRAFWLALGALLLFLGVNKQLDLQSALTAIGRCVALEQGWYAERGAAQRRFLIALAAGGAAFVALAAFVLRREMQAVGVAFFGFALLCVFVMMRAVSFHDFDAFINARVFGLRWNWIVELGALFVIIAGAQRRR